MENLNKFEPKTETKWDRFYNVQHKHFKSYSYKISYQTFVVSVTFLNVSCSTSEYWFIYNINLILIDCVLCLLNHFY